MTFASMSQRDRRALTVGTIIISMLFLFAIGLPTFRSWEATQLANASDAARDLSSVLRARRTYAAVHDTLVARQHRFAVLDSSLLSGASASGIAAALASRLGELADDNAVKITTLQLRPDTVVSNGLVRVDVRVTGVADVTGLAGFVKDVEGQKTPMVVKELSVSQPEPAASDAKPEALRIDLLVSGLGAVRSGAR